MVYTYDVFKEELIKNSSGLDEKYTTDDVVKKLHIICSELDRCSKMFNLTAICEPDEVLKKHIIDCLFLAAEIDKLAGDGEFKVLDVGSGAGFPSLPLAAAVERASVTALDSTAKKIGYIKATSELMEVSGFDAVASRAEEAARSEMRENYDFVCARAVARLSVLMELCVPFLKVGGYFVSMKGAAADEEIAEAKNAANKLGCEFIASVPYSISDLPDKRFLVIYKKNSKTIDMYPRNYSQISKKPL